jgi:hypothetical protein
VTGEPLEVASCPSRDPPRGSDALTAPIQAKGPPPWRGRLTRDPTAHLDGQRGSSHGPAVVRSSTIAFTTPLPSGQRALRRPFASATWAGPTLLPAAESSHAARFSLRVRLCPERQRRRRNRVVARLPPLRPERKRPGRGGRSRPMVLLPRGCACGVPWGGPSRVADPPSTVADGQGRRSTTAPIAATSPRSSGGRLLLANISRAFALPCSTPAKSM